MKIVHFPSSKNGKHLILRDRYACNASAGRLRGDEGESEASLSHTVNPLILYQKKEVEEKKEWEQAER